MRNERVQGMTDNEFEQMLTPLLQKDASLGTEAFRDSLLARCLAVLNTEEMGIELGDDELNLLAAAGDLSYLAQLKLDSKAF